MSNSPESALHSAFTHEQAMSPYYRSVERSLLRNARTIPIVATYQSAMQLEYLFSYLPHAYRHSIRVGAIANTIAIDQRFTQEGQDDVTLAGLLHDIGKSLVEDSLAHFLDLSPDEQRIVKVMHVRHGIDLVMPHLPRIGKIIAGHHEFPQDTCMSYPRSPWNEPVLPETGNRRAPVDPSLIRMQAVIAFSDQLDAMTDPTRQRLNGITLVTGKSAIVHNLETAPWPDDIRQQLPHFVDTGIEVIAQFNRDKGFLDYRLD